MESAWISQWYLDEDNNSFFPNTEVEIEGEDTIAVVDESKRKVLFHNNSIWWDPRFIDMVENVLPAQQPIPPSIGDYEWASQYIHMSDRTQAMFDDDVNYPYLHEGTNIGVEPDFANNKDLIDEWVSYVVTNSTPGTPNGGDLMPKWRTNTVSMLWMPDWPMLANLSYTKPELLTGGLYDLPLGDLNWFPSEKGRWKWLPESKVLWEALKSGDLPMGITKNEMQNAQFSVYPNPCSKTTNVEFELNKAANVEINIYDLVGKKLKSIDLGYMIIGKQNVSLELGDLNSGMYLLQITTDSDMAGGSTMISIIK
jgi:hypothetical protein